MHKKIKIAILLLSVFFVLFSFTPSLYELFHAKDLPKERFFVLEHNYMFDYNFYLSRIREGGEGRWLVSEKYYNLPHAGSFFQIVYLYLGKIGNLLNLSPPAVYNLSRLLFGFTLLMLIGSYLLHFFPGWWAAVGYLLIVTSGSYPILIKMGTGWRFATHMGWWSAIDSLQRITFIPHVLIGQIFLVLIVWQFVEDKSLKSLRLLKLMAWGVIGFIAGIIFPPTLIVVYTVFGVMSVIEFLESKSPRLPKLLKKWTPRIVFVLLSFPSLVYLSLMFKVAPWSALALFDVQHRIILPYREYALALGPILPLGVAGLLLALFNKEKKFMATAAWITSVALLFLIFEKVPQQSPSRFTEAMPYVPLGIFATYLFKTIWDWCQNLKFPLVKLVKIGSGVMVAVIVLVGIGVMASMVLWLTDQAYGKRIGAWQVPIGAQIAYPLKDFMDGVFYLRDHTPKNTVVLGYVTSGNFIPAYAGNYVYIGHANTPDEDSKEKTAALFFSGKMNQNEGKEFLKRERVSYIYFGPQEKELGKIEDLVGIYPFLTSIYFNPKVVIYKTELF